MVGFNFVRGGVSAGEASQFTPTLRALRFLPCAALGSPNGMLVSGIFTLKRERGACAVRAPAGALTPAPPTLETPPFVAGSASVPCPRRRASPSAA